MAAAASRVTLKVPKAFISMVVDERAHVVGRAAAADGAPAAHAAAGDVDDDRQRADRLGGGDGRTHVVVVVDVAAHGHDRVAQLLGQVRGAVAGLIEDGDARPELDEASYGGCPQPPGAPRDDG